MTGDGPKMVHFRPKMAQHGRLVNAPKWSKGAHIKGTKMVNLSLFDHLGPFWAHLDPFGPFQTRIDILLRSTSATPYFVHLGQKNHFWLKWSKRVQMDPKGVPNNQKDSGWPFWSLLNPFWTTLERWQACHVWPFLVQNGPFLGHPQSWTVDPRVKKRLIITSPMCGLLVEPHFILFGT